jgi:threonine dehydratase
VLDAVDSRVQGLTPPYSGQINVDICRATLDGTVLAEDELIYAAQERLVEWGETVEPAGAAAAAAVFSGLIPELRASRERPLKVAVVVSGGNPDPAQLESVRAAVARRKAASTSGQPPSVGRERP